MLATSPAADIIAAIGTLVIALTGFLALFIRRSARRATAQAVDAVTRLHRSADPLWTFIDNLPLPCWQKDVESRMLWINAQYSLQWNIQPRRYEGQFDSVIWPPDVVAQFVAHDRRVVAERIVLETTEEIPDVAGDLKSPRRLWRIWKFPVLDAEDRVVGVGGFAAPLSLSLEGYRHDPSQDGLPRPALSKWAVRSLGEKELAGFGTVLASILGVGVVREATR